MATYQGTTAFKLTIELILRLQAAFKARNRITRQMRRLLPALLAVFCFAGAAVFAESESGDGDEPKSFSKICIMFDDGNNASNTRPTQGRFIIKNGEGASIGKDVVMDSRKTQHTLS